MNKFRKKIYVWLLFVCILSINVFSMPQVKAASGVEVKYEVIRDWKCGLTGKITILNNSSKDLDQWKLEFDWDRKILNVWNAKIESSGNNHYIISFSQCNKVIPSGKSIS
ncbi:MAG TPA: cellulose binding domain-containing protein, partial [Clostridia bacterium]